MPDKKEFQGAWVVVTGGSRGIGRAIALDFASKGANVAIVYLDHRVQAQQVLNELKALGVEAEEHATDVKNFSAINELFADFIKRHGRIDVLVNCAGINRDRTFTKLTVEQWHEVIDTNLTGAFNCSKAVWDQMKTQNYGRIVSISSVVGQAGNFGQTNYSASKAGLLGFTKSLAQEGARNNITVNAICPGFVDTEALGPISKEERAAAQTRIPMRRFGRPEEVAAAVRFLASEESSYITGSVLKVDGGIL